MGIIMKQLSKLIKIINFKIKVSLSYSLVQLFLYKYITLKFLQVICSKQKSWEVFKYLFTKPVRHSFI